MKKIRYIIKEVNEIYHKGKEKKLTARIGRHEPT